MKYTIKDFQNQFKTDDICLQYIFEKKYSKQSKCEKCSKKFSYYKIQDRKCYACSFCGHQIHPLANTIFHKSSTPLKSWFFAIFLFSVSKNGVSGKELERQLGVTYKCAYRIGQQIRKLFKYNSNLLTGTIEIDETYIGGKESNKHKSKRTENTQGRSLKTKTPIIGAVERNGNIVAKVVCSTQDNTVRRFVREHIQIQSEVYTDEYRSYNSLFSLGYKHSKIYHSQKEYVNKNVYTNTIEGFWSQLKRSIHGTYHKVSKKYLQNYVDEFSFRYNLRKSEIPIFNIMIGRIV